LRLKQQLRTRKELSKVTMPRSTPDDLEERMIQRRAYIRQLHSLYPKASESETQQAERMLLKRSTADKIASGKFKENNYEGIFEMDDAAIDKTYYETTRLVKANWSNGRFRNLHAVTYLHVKFRRFLTCG
jgi:hypothetical protein